MGRVSYTGKEKQTNFTFYRITSDNETINLVNGKMASIRYNCILFIPTFLISGDWEITLRQSFWRQKLGP